MLSKKERIAMMLKKKREAEQAAAPQIPQHESEDPQEEAEEQPSDHEGEEEAEAGELEFEDAQPREKLQLPGEISKEKGSSALTRLLQREVFRRAGDLRTDEESDQGKDEL
jgi:hypothetical protein